MPIFSNLQKVIMAIFPHFLRSSLNFHYYLKLRWYRQKRISAQRLLHYREHKKSVKRASPPNPLCARAVPRLFRSIADIVVKLIQRDTDSTVTEQHAVLLRAKQTCRLLARARE